MLSLGSLRDDDFMAANSSAFWGPPGQGRGDLAIMRALGANAVRLYGNDPALGHSEFLDEAKEQELQVIAGISDYPYIQMRGNCRETNFDCYHQIKRQYLANLRRGFLLENRSYHPALRSVIIMNEPDLKFVGGPPQFCKALVSAFDAVLDAEREVDAKGQAPNFTVTFSFGVCPKCPELGFKPALGQMLELKKAMRNPESVGYKQRNDLWLSYKTRFANSVNTANPYSDIRRLFLDDYDRLFQGTPVFIGEYHSPGYADQARDLAGILEVAADPSTLLTGISFFEFQVRYDKGGSEKGFGMFGLDGERHVVDTRIAYHRVRSYCLEPVKIRGTLTLPGGFLGEYSAPINPEANAYVHTALVEAYGGRGVTHEQLCPLSTSTSTRTTTTSTRTTTTATTTKKPWWKPRAWHPPKPKKPLIRKAATGSAKNADSEERHSSGRENSKHHWGSTFHILEEKHVGASVAVSQLGRKGLAPLRALRQQEQATVELKK